MELTGIEFWMNYLDNLLISGEIDEVTHGEWLEKYDGYEMTWTFIDPSFAREDGNLEAACIYGNIYVNGGFCSGVKMTKTGIEPLAVWFTFNDLEAWTRAIGFSNTVDDSPQWRLKRLDVAEKEVWQSKRWLPREARNKNYYLHEYRFTKHDIVGVYRYTFDGVRLYDLQLKQEITLQGTAMGLSYASLAFGLSCLYLLLNF